MGRGIAWMRKGTAQLFVVLARKREDGQWHGNTTQKQSNGKDLSSKGKQQNKRKERTQ